MKKWRNEYKLKFEEKEKIMKKIIKDEKFSKDIFYENN
jgi:hypothetical protein